MGQVNSSKLSQTEAKKLLSEFLEDGVNNIEIVIAHANQAGVECDYSINSLVPFLQWALSEMRIHPTNPDLSLPEWIRNTPGYEEGLFDFDERSKNLICFAAYYLGETFVRTFPQLTWGTGNRESAIANLPVVKGFSHDQELPPMWVIQNVFRRIIENPGRCGDVRRMIETWSKSVV